MTQAAPRLKYRPEIDGVRAIAVLAVLGFHLSFLAPGLRPYFGGGFLGVDLFFVLSGMLITELIVGDHLATDRASLGGFYQRRAYRLLPALVAFLVIAPIYFQLDDHAGVETLRNYVSIVSYVDFGHLTHAWNIVVSQVWTLIVEWEYYLFWPLALILALRRGVAPRRLAPWVAAAALAMTALRAGLFLSDGHNWNLSYHLAWLRFDELLVGCAVGLSGARPQAPNWLRTLAGAFLLYAIAQARFQNEWLYVGGMLAIAVSSAIVVQPRETPWFLDRFLASRPMVWIGKLSYSLYLWSATFAYEVGNHGRSWPVAVRLLVATVGSFAVAALSYYLIERRFRMPSRRAAGAETLPGPSEVATDAELVR